MGWRLPLTKVIYPKMQNVRREMDIRQRTFQDKREVIPGFKTGLSRAANKKRKNTPTDQEAMILERLSSVITHHSWHSPS